MSARMGLSYCSSDNLAHRSSCGLVLSALWLWAIAMHVVVMGGGAAFGQCTGGACSNPPFSVKCSPTLRHGSGGRAEASDSCVGETLNASGEIFFGDNFADAWRVASAVLRVNGVLQSGGADQPIILIIGNAVCTNSGGICDPNTGANCVFPCVIGPANCACSDGPLSLPGAPLGGSVVVGTNYLVQPSDVGPLEVRFDFSSLDLGTFDCTNTPTSAKPVVAIAQITVPNCNDQDGCTVDCCALGVCSHTSDCLTVNSCRGTDGVLRATVPPISCDDHNDCTTDACVNDTNPATACCTHSPACLTAADCDDGDTCTTDACVAGCCTHTPLCLTPSITCPPDKVFECDAVGAFGDPTVNDNCSANPIVECTEESTPGKLPQERTIIRTCTVTNDCGNTAQCRQRIDIVDTTPPTVTCPPDCTLECGDVQCVPPQCDDPSCQCGGVATCEDNCSACTVSVTCEVIPKGCIAGQAAGLTPPPKLTVVRTYSGTDAVIGAIATGQGNIGTCVQHIEIVDTTPPVLDPVICSRTIRICAGADLSDFTPPACTDTCGTCGVICVRSDHQPLPGPPPNGPITITCVSSDECGNESSCAINVVISDGPDCFKVIPTMSEWGLVILTLLLLTGAKIFFGHRHVAASS